MSNWGRGRGRKAAWIAIVAGALVLVVSGLAISAPLRGHRAASNRAAAYTNRTVVYTTPPPTAPSDETLPLITGRLIVGQTLSASTGGWAGTPPIAYAYQWQTCGSTCSPIAGATSSALKLAPAQLNKHIQVVVKASNIAGAVDVTSPQTGLVWPNAQEVRTALGGALSPKFTFTFTAPSGGKLVVNWYYVPKGAHIARRAKPVLVASGKKSFANSGKGKVKMKLTRKGRKLLKGSKRVKITMVASFTPTGQSKTTRKKTHTFKR